MIQNKLLLIIPFIFIILFVLYKLRKKDKKQSPTNIKKKNFK